MVENVVQVGALVVLISMMRKSMVVTVDIIVSKN
jgi:hypothetical protein